ncbi:hypothetical protein DNFV4_01621 [Nitrospira tepida]|uniref:Uncharacterized protein n=1 Tax=Nitrospira tepida TaxID=2973512 RepID=A0AA86MY42_9BACT|nr:hypothetical protein [Nitrospira tepida]CAI4031193.1 hypothetical protein DNFV4_01621 [Nitrospira tepida]
MRFEKGRRKTGGRKRGTPNKGTIEMKSFALGLLEDPEYQTRLRARILSGKAPHMEVLLHHYTYGKPKTTLEARQVTIIVDRSCKDIVEAQATALEDHSTRDGSGQL